jgi:uncharacterized membrane protein
MALPIICDIQAAGLLGGRDLFQVWRLLLTTICAIYAAVVAARSLWRWGVLLSGPGRTTSMMRSYMVVQLLRLRIRRFAWEFTRIGLCILILVVVLYWHTRCP